MKKKCVYLLFCGWFAGLNLQAAELLTLRGIAVGDGRLHPKFRLEAIHNDNLTAAATNPIKTFGTFYSPGFSYVLRSAKKRLFADYHLSGATYEDSRRDDYLDHRASFGYQYTPTNRVSLGVEGEYFDSQDARGTGAAEGSGVIQTSPDEWHHVRLKGKLAYGASGARGRFEGDVAFTNKDYDNNRRVTAVRDREDIAATGRFYYRILPKTSLLLEGRATRYDYDRSAPNSASLDGLTSQALLGITWKGTFKTTGTARFGYIRKDFDAAGRRTGQSFSWDFGVQWRPKSYSVFSLNTARNFQETNGVGDFIIDDSVSLSWAHSWNTRLRTALRFSFAQNDFEADNTGRADERLSAGADVIYKPGDNLELGLGYNYERRDSNQNTFDYERNIIRIFASVAF